MRRFKIKSNISEKQIEADVAGYFAWISKFSPFRLLDIDENITGADKKFFDSGFAFFMQFKVSQGLEPVGYAPLVVRKNRSKLHDIREFRDRMKLSNDPSLYFGLRKKAQHALDYQHNILLNFANKSHSQAFYVAPLSLNKTDYYNSLFNSVNRYLSHPFDYRSKRIFQENWVSYLGHIPFLKEHISIVPHEHVDTHNHFYSYSTSGDDIAWHSPELLSEKPSRLSDVLVENINKCIYEGMISELEYIESNVKLGAIESISDIEKIEPETEVMLEQIDGSIDQLHPIERIQKRGRYIYKKYGIRLVLFLVNREYVNSLR